MHTFKLLLSFFFLLALLHGNAVQAENSVQLVARLKPSLVSISIIEKSEKAKDAEAEVVEDLIGQKRGSMSGLIIDAEGLILTGQKFFDEPGEIRVQTDDGKTYLAKRLGLDKRTGIGLLKIEAKNLPSVTLNRAAPPQLGEAVLALGRNGLTEKAQVVVTNGILSSINVPVDGGSGLLQSNVTLAPGMGGGPLVSAKSGEVIGIITMLFRNDRMHLVFATPIQQYLDIAAELKATGSVRRGRFGVTLSELTPQVAQSLAVPDGKGVLLREVDAQGAAYAAGLKAGDVILAMDQTPITSSLQLVNLVANTKPGQQVSVTAWRRGAKTILKLRLQEKKDE